MNLALSISNCLLSPFSQPASCQASILCLDVNLDYLVIEEIINLLLPCKIRVGKERTQ